MPRLSVPTAQEQYDYYKECFRLAKGPNSRRFYEKMMYKFMEELEKEKRA